MNFLARSVSVPELTVTSLDKEAVLTATSLTVGETVYAEGAIHGDVEFIDKVEFTESVDFKKPPLVPSPSEGREVANKHYVDNLLGQHSGGLNLFLNYEDSVGILSKIPRADPVLLETEGTGDELVIASFTTAPLGVHEIPMGQFRLNQSGQVDSVLGNMFYKFKLYKKSLIGPDALLGSSMHSDDVNSSYPSMYSMDLTLTSPIAVEITDRLRMDLIQTGSSLAKLTSSFNGDQSSYLQTTLNTGISLLSSENNWTKTNTFDMSPMVPTKTAGDNTKAAASTEFVQSAMQSFQTIFSSDKTYTGVNTYTKSPVVPTPTLETDAANKEYVDGKLNTGLFLYLNRDVDTGNSLSPDKKNEVDGITKGQSGGSNTVLVAVFPSPSGVPNMTKLEAGTYSLRQYGRKLEANRVYYFAVLKKLKVDGTITEIAQSTDVEIESMNGITVLHEMFFTLQEVELDISDRLQIELFTKGMTMANPNNVYSFFNGAVSSIFQKVNSWSAINKFTQSPIVPVPTLETDAANKAYVDDKASSLLGSANSWSAINTFTQSPVVPTPTLVVDAANKAYVDGKTSGTLTSVTQIDNIATINTTATGTINLGAAGNYRINMKNEQITLSNEGAAIGHRIYADASEISAPFSGSRITSDCLRFTRISGSTNLAFYICQKEGRLDLNGSKTVLDDGGNSYLRLYLNGQYYKVALLPDTA